MRLLSRSGGMPSQLVRQAAPPGSAMRQPATTRTSAYAQTWAYCLFTTTTGAPLSGEGVHGRPGLSQSLRQSMDGP